MCLDFFFKLCLCFQVKRRNLDHPHLHKNSHPKVAQEARAQCLLAALCGVLQSPSQHSRRFLKSQTPYSSSHQTLPKARAESPFPSMRLDSKNRDELIPAFQGAVNILSKDKISPAPLLLDHLARSAEEKHGNQRPVAVEDLFDASRINAC